MMALTPLSSAVGWCTALWQGACVSAAAALILRLLRRADSPTRYAAAYGALLGVPGAFAVTVARTFVRGPSGRLGSCSHSSASLRMCRG